MASTSYQHFEQQAMPISVNLDLVLVKRKMSLTELSERVGLTLANLSILKTNKAKAIRFSTLDALCRELQCQPGDLLEYTDDRGVRINESARRTLDS